LTTITTATSTSLILYQTRTSSSQERLSGTSRLRIGREVARQVPDMHLAEEEADLLGRRDLDVNYDWSQHVDRYYHEEFATGGY
jgi:hypothetical protein